MKTLLTADWTNLVVAAFETDKKFLTKYLPSGTELNTWNGKYYMSIVAFMFSKPALYGIPSPFFRCFEEINLRFYVRRQTLDGWKNGVVFIKEIAPYGLVGWMAKYLYHENYITLPLKHTIASDATGHQVEYYWKINQQWNYIKLYADSVPADPDDSSIGRFIRDHYIGYTKGDKGTTWEFEIAHRPWEIFSAQSFHMNIDVEAVYGREFCPYLNQKPFSVFLMDGSRTKVSSPVIV